MKIIGITGGKGGTGKSTVATALAYALAKNHGVLLVDADVDCPNDHLLLSIERKELCKVEQRIPMIDDSVCIQCGMCGPVCKPHAMISVKSKKPFFMKAQCNGCGACHLICPKQAISWDKKEIGVLYTGKNHGIEMLSGELKANEPASEFVVNALNEKLEKIQDNYDYIVVDTAAGTHCPVIAALEVCSTVFAVTEPTPLGKHDLELILQLLRKVRIKDYIVINKSNVGDEKGIVNLSQKFKVPIICMIPYSKRIVKDYSKGNPITSKHIKKIIEAL
jgi:MinD superfamily P-loop ATPase